MTFRFSLRYLDGERGRGRFLRCLAFTVVAAYVLVLSTNLLLLFALVADEPRAASPPDVLPGPRRGEAAARKKFAISRLGDVALIAAIALIWRTWGTLDVNAFLSAAIGAENSDAARGGPADRPGGPDEVGPVPVPLAGSRRRWRRRRRSRP